MEWFLILRGKTGFAVVSLGSTFNQLHVVMEKVGLFYWATTMGLAGIKFNNFFHDDGKKSPAFYIYEFAAKTFNTFQSQGFICVSYKLGLQSYKYPYHSLGRTWQNRRHLEEWPRTETWTLGIKPIIININQEKGEEFVLIIWQNLVLGKEEYFLTVQS